MITLRLDPETEKRLARLAKKTGRTKTDHAREAILDHLDELETTCLAVDRLKRIRRGSRTYSDQEVKRELGL